MGSWCSAGALLLVGLACGCATTEVRRPAADEPLVVGYPAPRDPLIKLNRAVFAFNDRAYRWALIPLAKGYEKAPRPARRAVARFFWNLETPVYLASRLLRLEPRAAGKTLARFLVNSTAGIGGLFDPAAAWIGWEREPARLSDALAKYGVGYGAYLVLPLLGPADLRGAAALGGEFFLSPIPYLLGQPESSLVRGFGSFSEFAPQWERYERLRDESEDPYLFFRNLHLQGARRDAEY